MSLHATLTEIHRIAHWYISGATAVVGDIATTYSGDADRDPADSDNLYKIALVNHTGNGTCKLLYFGR